MGKFLGIAVLLFGMVGPAPGQQVYIAAPDRADFGKLVVASVEGNPGDVPPNIAMVQFRWLVYFNDRPLPATDYIVWPDGSRMVLSTGVVPGTYSIVLDTDYVVGQKVKVTVGRVEKVAYTDVKIVSPPMAIKQIAVSGSSPIPPPSPPPPPLPKPISPVFPIGKYGLASFSYHALTDDAAIKAADKAKVGRALSSSFGSIASQIVAIPTFPRDARGILALTKSANDQAIAVSGVSDATIVSFKRTLEDELYALMFGQKPVIVTADDIAAAWREISAGLDAVK